MRLPKILSGLMILSTIGLGFAFSGPSVSAADKLIFVTENAEGDRFYLNQNWLKAEKFGYVDFVSTMRLAEPSSDGILFVDSHHKGHCETSRIGMMSIQLYNVNDKLVTEKKFKVLEIDIVDRGSVNELLLDAACRILKTAR